ncbi:MAG: CHASE2 domain-containing protein [Synechococcaceae cyanobacterium]|nr:CHASE2 domain-containing protein [Synechococcaceae cyanobacterium]
MAGPRARRLAAQLRQLLPYGMAGAALVALQLSPINETLNLLFYDLITGLRPAASARARPVALIGIDEGDIARYGWPIDDSLLCRAIDRLLAGGALAVGLDLYRDKGVGPQQQCLRERFRREPRLVSIFNAAEGIPAVPGTPPNRRAFNDLIVDSDGVVRRDLVHVSGQDAATVALPLRLLEVASGDRGLRARLEAGKAEGPWLEAHSGGYQGVDAAGYQRMLAYLQPGSVQLSSLRQLLEPPGLPAAALQGRIVLIGSTAPSLRDLFPVPHTRFARGSRQLLVPGVELHAQRLVALQERRAGQRRLEVRTAPGWFELVSDGLAVLLGIALGEGFRNLRRSVIAVLLAQALLLGGASLLLFNAVWVGLSMPMACLGLMAAAAWVRRGGASQEQRQQIERLLGQTTSPAVAEALWTQRDQLLRDGRFEGRQLPVTVLFTDTCSFTSVSERLSPKELLDWLNRGMALFVPAICRRGGMVNKFTGDGLLAVFGAPLGQGPAADALAAIEAALAIQEAVAQLDRQLAAEAAPRLRLRIGVHSGLALAGSMGSSERLEYAVIGDAVNCASRLESLEKERQDNLCRVLVSSVTRDLLPPDAALRWREWGSMGVKGRQEPLQIWELLGRGSDTGSGSASGG